MRIAGRLVKFDVKFNCKKGIDRMQSQCLLLEPGSFIEGA